MTGKVLNERARGKGICGSGQAARNAKRGSGVKSKRKAPIRLVRRHQHRETESRILHVAGRGMLNRDSRALTKVAVGRLLPAARRVNDPKHSVSYSASTSRRHLPEMWFVPSATPGL